MVGNRHSSKVVPLPAKTGKARKSGINSRKEGSVRRINNRIYMDFVYLDARVRENTGLAWDDKTVNAVRKDLDVIMNDLRLGRRRFHEIFPSSPKRDYFRHLEEKAFNLVKRPEDVGIAEAAYKWYAVRRSAQRVGGRTLWGQQSHLKHYIRPFFGPLAFGDLNKTVFEQYVAWARDLKLKGEPVSNTTINKTLIPLRMICASAAAEYGWVGTYDPFANWAKLPEPDPWELIFPFSLAEQMSIRAALPAHWVPYVDFAFRVGPRPGEQIALRPGNIDWEARTVTIRTAVTRDEQGEKTEGDTKNKYSRRTIRLNDIMLEPLLAQREIHKKIGGEFFFCMEDGSQVDLGLFRYRVWIPALTSAGVQYRPIKQARHSFATNALTFGESPLWIAAVMGHRNTDMIIRVYSKSVANLKGIPDGGGLAQAYEQAIAAKANPA